MAYLKFIKITLFILMKFMNFKSYEKEKAFTEGMAYATKSKLDIFANFGICQIVFLFSYL